MQKRKILKPKPISGFPEYTPEIRRVEMRWIDTIRETFERYGYVNIETPSVEEAETLAAKGGDVDKEIYGLQRLNDDGEDKGARLALHFDLTVPTARYVAQHFNDLTFPFKRYQIQRVWRGERPQEGRFREFLQCDVDVIDQDGISHDFDAEIPLIAMQALNAVGAGPIRFMLNNRKILTGFYQGLGIENAGDVIRVVDKIDKLPAAEIERILTGELGLAADIAKACLALAQIRSTDNRFADEARALGVQNDPFEEGLTELAAVMDRLNASEKGACVAEANLGIARGLDYYTGVVYEAQLIDYPEYSTICAGGRYADLVGAYIKSDLPGVGISIGLTRLFAKLVKEGKISGERASPTDVLIARFPENDVLALDRLASQLRTRGINVEVYHETAKLKNQFRYAERKAIPYLWFAGDPHEVKDLGAGEQSQADPASWLPSRLQG
ncbi:MAG: histidine--tRNA ligase [Rhodobacterales bacterium CG15_BIG_FIL_POST_REV_8_21_14_020_59_13]|nr:MAG: histidine--tRNA ligase [Rhodobacterales bacterium CG15_BIG_FIL_POST_REV_8_21_14_020_59_13]